MTYLLTPAKHSVFPVGSIDILQGETVVLIHPVARYAGEFTEDHPAPGGGERRGA
jgi:hypothetical protein